ncbi:DUF945 family protein [Photobacterium carnosum]|uniref:DUF945 family protein n=1 Tax=Photobacterium carnosum TaxID=2023717 RepID=UPI001E4D3F45|nr:DUF945 family protein [Photobacterium carnosum]MCD9536052.1 DUF945 family protein [Photobacterium carnosum]MCD9547603.1 DUF945 family protein [Photobacterium carnosum]MCF2161414.1 DUF945 family protein [Photobacterium carnosum]MCF2305442.1 DUF945 family protein [Photobacterium carnosum]
MLKKILASAGAVAIIACGPLATGQIGQSIYMGAVENYHSPYMSITNKSFERGYLSSNAVSRIELKNQLKTAFAEQGLPTVWLVSHHIDNGFLGVKSTSEFVIDKKIALLVNQIWGKNVAPMQMVTDSGFTGTTHFVMTVNPMDYTHDDGVTASSKKLVVKGEFDPENSKSQFSYNLPELTVSTLDKESMIVKGINGEGKGQMQGNFWIGHQTFSLEHAKFTAADQHQFIAIDGVNVAMNNALSQPKGEKTPTEATQQVTNTNTINVAKLTTLDGQQYKDIAFKLALKDLNYKAISQLATMEQSLQAAQNPAQIKQAMVALDLLIAHGATVDLSQLSVKTPQGTVNAQVLLNIKPGLEHASTNLTAVTDQLSGNINIVIPEALVAKEPLLAAKLPVLVNQKIVTKQDDNYQLQVKIIADQVEFSSGAKLPLAMMALFLQ